MMYKPVSPIGITLKMRDLSSLELFRRGFDTKQIAEAKGQPESRVYNWIARAKEREREQIQRLKTMEFDRTFRSVEEIAPLSID